ncbi:pilus assembly protein CpaE [Nocardioides gansuensis]|uniref:Pilus assembly protein CpaE n=1 Tax=Nocardioides gansuensis TaxID=2138300 RepID=A0A2T8FE51_9ACTN|nr:pilus assembly protein CpaE [Nocardioides gansuensis]PVG83975.1 pilus assembly protein CpaE [Nocardioides gansuensis]
MISLDLARQLKNAGVTWSPAPGDTFMIPHRDLDDQVFAVSDMVVEVLDLPTGRVLAFNGTTEWALDSIMQRDVVWLPREDQLRSMLGGGFVSLQAVPGGFVVEVASGSRTERHVDVDAEGAYARALLSVLARPQPLT